MSLPLSSVIKKLELHKNKNIILGIIFIVGILLRFWSLGTPGLWSDEGQVFMVSSNIVDTGYPLLDSGYYYSRDIPHLYLSAISMVIFDTNEFGVRFVSAFSGTALILVVYLIVSNITDTRFAMVGAGMTAIHPWMVFYSRFARSYMLMVLLFTVAIYFMIVYLKNARSLKYITYFSIASFTAILTHQVAQMLLLTIPAMFIFDYVINEPHDREAGNNSPFILHYIYAIAILLLARYIYNYAFQFSYYTYLTEAGPNEETGIVSSVLSQIPFDTSFSISNATFIQNSIPLIFVLVAILAFIYFVNYLLSDQSIQGEDFTLFMLFILMILLSALGFAKRDVNINRATIHLFPLFVVTFVCLLFYFHRVVNKNFDLKHIATDNDNSQGIPRKVGGHSLYNILVVFLLLIVILSSMGLLYESTQISTIDYGDKIDRSHSIFEGFSYYQDHKTTYEYVNRHAGPQDTIIILGNPKFSSAYLRNGLNVDYFVWHDEELTVNREYIFIDDVRVITKYENFETIISNENDVWVITTHSINTRSRVYHIPGRFSEYAYSQTPEYVSEDYSARVIYEPGGSGSEQSD